MCELALIRDINSTAFSADENYWCGQAVARASETARKRTIIGEQ